MRRLRQRHPPRFPGGRGRPPSRVCAGNRAILVIRMGGPYPAGGRPSPAAGTRTDPGTTPRLSRRGTSGEVRDPDSHPEWAIHRLLEKVRHPFRVHTLFVPGSWDVVPGYGECVPLARRAFPGQRDSTPQSQSGTIPVVHKGIRSGRNSKPWPTCTENFAAGGR